MLQDLASLTGGTAWVVGSMFFFLGVWLAIAIWTLRRRREEMDARARLPLDENDESKSEVRRLDLDE